MMYPQQQAQDSRTLWMGDIEHWMDENYISSLFLNTRGLVSVKVIRDKNTGLPSGYSFVEFATHEIAQHVINTYNGINIPGTHKNFRLNWGVFGGGQKSGTMEMMQAPIQPVIQMQLPTMVQRQPNVQAPQADYSIYVADLDPTITDQQLGDFFSLKYKSVISAKVIIDPLTKMGKGYGFVKFSDMAESNKAMSDMNGTLFRGRHIKTNSATWKSAQMANIQYQQSQYLMQDPIQMQMQNQGGIQSYNDYQQQQYMSMIMQQQLLTSQIQHQSSTQNVNTRANNPPVYSKKVEKPNRVYIREEYSENSMDFLLNKIEYDTLLKFID